MMASPYIRTNAGERMKRWILKFAPLFLAFLLGVSAKVVWDKRQQIQDFFSNLFLYYQD